MKLSSFLDLISTWHIELIIVESGNKEPLLDQIGLFPRDIDKWGGLKVIRVDSTLETSETSQITKSIQIRPILSVVCLWEEEKSL